MPNIQINIKDKVARADRAIIVCDNSDYTAVFDFDDEWSAYDTKTARFVYCGTYTDVVFSGNECPVPVMQDTRAVTVGVFAGDLHTTTPAYFMCMPSILCGGGVPADPTPEVYAQIMELLNKDSGVWYPAVDDAGNMSWTRSISETAPQPINIKGPKGDAGAQGETGPQGPKGDTGAPGPQGPKGDVGADGKDGMDGKDGADGQDGSPGADGKDGVDGKSAYELAQDNGFQGTMQEWLASLVGADGKDGNDGVSPAVSVAAITGGNRVTITDAEGAKTFDVMDGAQGASGADGKDYVLTDTDKQEIAEAAAGFVDVPSVQHDWNQNDSTQPDYIKNRPFYEEVEERVVTWDGDTTGKIFVNAAQGINLYKVSDLTPTMDEILGGTITLSNGNTITISSLDMFMGGSTNTAWMFSECAVVSVPADGTVVRGITLPEAGLYFCYVEMNGFKVVRAEWNSGTIHKIAQKYLPDFMMEITTDSTYDEVREIVNNDVLPYLQLRSDYSYARLYLSSIESDRFIFGSFPVKHNITYQIELREPTGWVDVESLYVAETDSSGKELYINSSTSGSTKKFKITVDDSGSPTITNESDSTNTWKPTNLPIVTASDAGKFLRVSDTGEWVAETIPNASGVSF